MPDASIKGRREESVRQLQAEAEREQTFDSPRSTDEQLVDLAPYLSTIWVERRMIAFFTSSVMVATLLFTTLVLSKSYQATAILRPVPKAATAGRIVGMLGGFGMGALSPLQGIMGSGPGSDEAQEYMTILQSFAFNTALVERHHLGDELFRRSSNPLLGILQYNSPQWRAYARLKKRFWCEYSIKTGNITLYFTAKTPEDAQEVLGYFIDDLRQKLRNREVLSAGAAIDSMKAEVRMTSDSLLQTLLYELIAKQTQQLKLAQVEADFAFTVLEPPAAPDKPYRPLVLIDCIVAGLLAFLLSAGFAILKHS